MAQKGIKRNLFQRIFGIPATPLLTDASAWIYSDEDKTVVIDLHRVAELKTPGSGVRIEHDKLPDRVLVVHGNDGAYHAFRNRCGHGGRRLDPVPGEEKIQCCSVGKTTCDYTGAVLSGSSKKPTDTYRVVIDGGTLTIYLD